MDSSTTERPVTTALLVLAGGRVALGAGAIAAPGTLARIFGAGPTPEIDYLARVYGARAIALGAAYLLAGPAERERLQRLCLGVDVSDTIAGLSGACRHGAPTRGSLARAVAITGSYAAVGAVRLVADLRREAA